MLFYSRLTHYLVFLSSCCSSRCYGYLYKPSLGRTFSSGYASDLSNLTITSSIAPFWFILIIDDFVFFIIFTKLFRFLTQTFYTNCLHSFWVSMRYSLLKASTKAGWLCFYFDFALQLSTFCFFRHFATLFLKSDALLLWNTFEVFKHATLVRYFFQHKYNSFSRSTSSPFNMDF